MGHRARRGRMGVARAVRTAEDGSSGPVMAALGMDELSQGEQLTEYRAEYWNTPKRCSLWTIDPATRTVDFVMDLPSNGDTCFASAVTLSDDQYLVYNYTSPLDDPDLPWNDGQVGTTYIYRTTLTLP